MAFTITTKQIAVAIRVAIEEDLVDSSILAVLEWIVMSSKEQILAYAPHAPDAVHNLALVRLSGYIYEVDPTDQFQSDNPLSNSGATALLAQWRIHNAGVITGDDAAPAPVPLPAGSIPNPPDDGHYILTSNEGVLTWVSFPAP